MFLLLLACAGETTTPSDKATPVDSAPTATDSDSNPPDSQTDSPSEDSGRPIDTAPDSGDSEDSATDSGGDSEEPGWRSALYPKAWTPGFSVDGAFLHDFSYAGYHNGEDPLPSPSGPEFSAIDYGADNTGATDACPQIQAAIDAAEAAGGGVVHLPAGEYRCEDRLIVAASNVIVRGDGSGATKLYFTRHDSMSDLSHLNFEGNLKQGADLPLTADAKALTSVVTVNDASSLAPGDDVALGWIITAEFTEDHGMTGTWVAFTDQWKPQFRRTVLAVDTSVSPHTVTLDVPIRYDALTRDGASLREETGLISECGVTGLAVSTVVSWTDAWANDRSHAIGFEEVKDCFMDDVVSYESPNSDDTRANHLQSGGVIVVNSKRVTITNTTFEMPQHRGDGGNGYLFEVSRASEILISDSTGRRGRHNFIQNWDFGTSGCVFLRTVSEDGAAQYSADVEWLTWLGTSEFHHSLAMANLIDQSTTNDGWKGANRQDESSGAGHSATQNVFWNLSGGGELTSYQYGLGYVIGTTDITVKTTVWDILDSEGTSPEDYTEGIDEGATLFPASLYEDQLAARLARGEARW